MIRKLRRKFLVIAMLALLGTLAFLVAAIAVGNAILSANRADRAIALLYENGGAFPLPDSAPNPALGFDFQVREETPFETRYFIVHLSENQEVLSVDTEHIAALDRQTVIESLNAVLRSGAEKDMWTTTTASAFLRTRAAGARSSCWTAFCRCRPRSTCCG